MVLPQADPSWSSLVTWCHWHCSEGDQLCQQYPLLCISVAELWLPRSLWSGFLRGWELHSAVGWAMIQLPCLGQSRPASRVGQALCLRTQIRQACVLLSSLIRLCPPRLCRWTKQLQWLGLLLGHCREDSAGCCQPLSTSHHNQMPRAQVLPVPLRSLWGTTRVGAPKKGPTVGAGYAP